MGFGWESEYRKAFDNICDRIASFCDASPVNVPSPDILVKLYTSTLQTSHKKRSGVFYTPPEVVRFMCRDSLAHYLSNSTGLSFDHTLEFMDRITADGQNDTNIDAGMLLRADRALEAIRVFDPAAGCGAFICGMLDEIVRLRSGITKYLGDSSAKGVNDPRYMRNDPAQNADSPRTAPGRHPFILKYNAVTNSIHGTDIDAAAAEITKLRLWYELITEFERYRKDAEKAGGTADPDPGAFRCNIACADSLFEFDAQDFDVVIGNPPYISAVEGSRKDRRIRQAVRKKYPQLKGAFDIYTAFLLDGIHRLNDKGIYCWIVPNKLLVSQYAAPVLQHLKENGLRYAISVSDIKVFSGVGVYPVIVTGNKRDADGSGMNTADGFREHTTSGFREYAAGSLQQLEARCFVVRPEIKQYKTFADHDIKIASGAAGFQAATLKQYIKEISDMEDTIIQVPDAPDTAEPAGCPAGMDRCGFIPFAVSGSIDRYRLDRSNVRFMGTAYKNPFICRGEKISGRKWDLWCSEKICIAGMTKELEAYFSMEPLALGVGTYAVYDFGGMDPFYLLGLLNSKFMSWYLREKFYERHLAGGYLAVNKFILEQLPLVRADKKTEQEIARRAERIQRLSCRGTVAKRLLGEIDELVYIIFGLDGKDVDKIKNSEILHG
ncbi:MAG: hypothetical protein GX940_06905 [Clostridiaceae bacterium]|jgi:hypothetical protein|nr:hypothetical protein [Clostridiaceae bacterium]